MNTIKVGEVDCFVFECEYNDSGCERDKCCDEKGLLEKYCPDRKKEQPNPPKKENTNMKVPLFLKMERTIKSLGVGKFVVKQDKNTYNVCFKRVIIVGGLFEKNLAENIAKEYNNITAVLKKRIQQSMEKAEEQVEYIYSDICNEISGHKQKKICGNEECNGFDLSEENRCGRLGDITPCDKYIKSIET